jgi:hypothetical protein
MIGLDAGAAVDQQPRRIPLGQRMLRDAIRRERVVEGGHVHGSTA